MLYASLHELVHHFAGYIICGDWGTKTFNSFTTVCAKGNNSKYIATYLGPFFSFLMMYIGVYILKKGKSDFKKHLGFALIFAQLPFQRMTSPIFKMNDEYYATARLFGNSDFVYWLVLIAIWVICIPPLIVAFKAIENNNKALWFLFYFTLFPYLIWGPIFGGLEYLMINKQFLAQPIIGIGFLFIINEIITILAYFFTKKYINPYYVKPD